jgi:hypothetical protein
MSNGIFRAQTCSLVKAPVRETSSACRGRPCRRKLTAQPFDFLDPSGLPEVGLLGERQQHILRHF